MTLDQVTGLISSAESKFIADQRKAEQRILDFLSDGEPHGREEMARKVGGSIVAARAAVDALVGAGLVTFTGSGARGDPKRFRSGAPPTPTEVSKERPKYLDTSVDPLIVEETAETDGRSAILTDGGPMKTEETAETEETELTDEEVTAFFDRAGKLGLRAIGRCQTRRLTRTLGSRWRSFSQTIPVTLMSTLRLRDPVALGASTVAARMTG